MMRARDRAYAEINQLEAEVTRLRELLRRVAERPHDCLVLDQPSAPCTCHVAIAKEA